MRNKYDLAGAQKERYRRCAFCGKELYEALIRTCPEREAEICAYCCRLCGQSYMDGSMQGCRAADAGRQKAREKRKRDRAWS